MGPHPVSFHRGRMVHAPRPASMTPRDKGDTGRDETMRSAEATRAREPLGGQAGRTDGSGPQE